MSIPGVQFVKQKACTRQLKFNMSDSDAFCSSVLICSASPTSHPASPSPKNCVPRWYVRSLTSGTEPVFNGTELLTRMGVCESVVALGHKEQNPPPPYPGKHKHTKIFWNRRYRFAVVLLPDPSGVGSSLSKSWIVPVSLHITSVPVILTVVFPLDCACQKDADCFWAKCDTIRAGSTALNGQTCCWKLWCIFSQSVKVS